MDTAHFGDDVSHDERSDSAEPHHGATTAGDSYVPHSGNGGYEVTHYDLHLDYRVSSNRLEARASIELVTTETLDRLSLDLHGLAVSAVTIEGARVRKFTTRHGKLHVWVSEPLAATTAVRLDVRYGGNPGPVRGAWGEVGWEELEDGVIVAGQPNGAATWFPCDDHPAAKATYRLVVTADSPYLVVANGTLVSRQVGASRTRWEFEQRQPMATYLATLQVGQYTEVLLHDASSGGVRQVAAVPQRLVGSARTELSAQPDMMATFVRLFGPYPFDAYTVVVTDDELEIPVEAQGISVFGANHLDGSRTNERLVAHELAHQWFGNSLTVASWQHIWLNEGFACYAEWLWAEASGGPSADSIAGRQWDRLAELDQDLVVADPGPDLMFDDRLYKRGALTLHALRLTFGDDAFFTLLREWIESNRYGTVTTEGFVELAAHTSSEPTHIRLLLRQWLTQTGLPRLPTRR